MAWRRGAERQEGLVLVLLCSPVAPHECCLLAASSASSAACSLLARCFLHIPLTSHMPTSPARLH